VIALWEREVLLRWVLGRCCGGGVSNGGRLEGEEALKDALGLPFSRVGKIYPHVHTTGLTKCRVKALNVICGRKQKSGRGESEIERNTQRKKVNIPPLSRCHTVKADQKPTQTQRQSIGGLRSGSLFEVVAVGTPIDFSSRLTEQVNAASKSSKRRMHLRE